MDLKIWIALTLLACAVCLTAPSVLFFYYRPERLTLSPMVELGERYDFKVPIN